MAPQALQQMIESLDSDRGYLINLSSLKNYDEYTFNHSVNTSGLAVALGRHIGLERRQRYTLGQAGMRRKRLLARIVSIVDCYDAMPSARVYRNEPIPPPETLAHMDGGGRIAATAKDADGLRVTEVVSPARYGLSALETLV